MQRHTRFQPGKSLARGKPLRAKRKPYKPAKIVFHHNRVADLGCLITGGPAELHHVTSDGHQRIARDDRYVVPLAPHLHRNSAPNSGLSVEALGHAGFTREHGHDLYAVSRRLWARTEALWAQKHGEKRA